MAQLASKKRTKTARELAEMFGISERYVRYLAAESREDFEGRAAARQDEALELRAKGLSYSQIATVLSCSRDTAAGLVRRGNARRERNGLPKILPPTAPTQDGQTPA